MKFKSTCCFTFLILFFTASYANTKPTIIIVGDSLSAGYGIAISKGWVELLKQRLIDQKYDYQVINASISGDTTNNAASRLPALLKKYSNAIYIIQLGGNDGLQGIKIETIEKNLAKLIETIQKNKHPILLIGVRIPPNYGREYTDAFQNIYPKLAKKYHILLVPLLLNGIDENRNLIQADGVHPTEQAQNQMLDNVWVELKKILNK